MAPQTQEGIKTSTGVYSVAEGVVRMAHITAEAIESTNARIDALKFEVEQLQRIVKELRGG